MVIPRSIKKELWLEKIFPLLHILESALHGHLGINLVNTSIKFKITKFSRLKLFPSIPQTNKWSSIILIQWFLIPKNSELNTYVIKAPPSPVLPQVYIPLITLERKIIWRKLKIPKLIEFNVMNAQLSAQVHWFKYS